MANIISVTYPVNGSRNFVAVIQIRGDGSGDEANTVIVPVSALTGTPATFKIKEINWDLDGFSAALYWDATSPTLAASLPTYGDEMDFYSMGAPLINGAGAGVTGNLTIETIGLGVKGHGTIIIKGYH